MGLLVAAMAALAASEEPGTTSAHMVSVRDCGATGDGVADDTAAFQEAVARGVNDGKHVYVPRGTYRIASPIALKNIVLRGPEGAAWPADIDSLPSIIPTHRDGPAFHLTAGAALRGLDITYHWDSEPEHGPSAVLVSGIGVYISNVRVRYAWDGILTDGEHNVGRINFENIFMVAVRNVGVRVTGTWDVPRLHNIEVWNAGPVARGLDKGVGFLLGKNDLIRLTDCFAFAMQTGFLLDDAIDGCTIKGETWGVMNGCATDYCGTGIAVEGAHTLSVSGGSFWNHQTSLLVDGADARVRVSGSELKSNGAPVIDVRNSDHTVVTGCSILRPMEEYDPPAIVLRAGRTTIGSNHIESYGIGVQIAKGVRSVALHGNTIVTHGQGASIRQDAPD